jgi:type II secretory pathway pseudopilin PulG
MIELIFVIVILGILAAVAIPKLAATRDDAEVSTIAQNIGTAMAEISSYSTSKGASDKDFLVMSNAMQKMKKSGHAVLSDNKAVISIGGSDCLSVEVIKNATNDDLKVSFINSTDTKCLSLQSAIDEKNYAIKLRGTSVTY